MRHVNLSEGKVKKKKNYVRNSEGYIVKNSIRITYMKKIVSRKKKKKKLLSGSRKENKEKHIVSYNSTGPLWTITISPLLPAAVHRRAQSTDIQLNRIYISPGFDGKAISLSTDLY